MLKEACERFRVNSGENHLKIIGSEMISGGIPTKMILLGVGHVYFVKTAADFHLAFHFFQRNRLKFEDKTG